MPTVTFLIKSCFREQSEGPVYTMDELAAYFATPSPRKPLLNVVSLDLANTSLHDMVFSSLSLFISIFSALLGPAVRGSTESI